MEMELRSLAFLNAMRSFKLVRRGGILIFGDHDRRSVLFILIPGRAQPLLQALEQTAIFVKLFLVRS